MYQLMIVEDEDLLREGLVTCVDWNGLGFSAVAQAGDGVEALTKIRETVPDMVITDIKMPHMDGIELIKILHEQYPQIKTLIISGYDDFAYAKEALRAGASEYLLKPVNLPELRTAVQTVVEQLNREKHAKAADQGAKVHTDRYTIYSQILLHNKSTDQVKKDLGEAYHKVDNGWHMVMVVEQETVANLAMAQDYMEVLEVDRQFESHVMRCLMAALPDTWKKWVAVLPVERNQRILCISGRSAQQVEQMQQAVAQELKGQIPPITTYCGEVYHGLGQLTQSFHQAQMACRMDFAQQWQSVLDLDSQAPAQMVAAQYDEKALIMEMKVGDTQGIYNQLQQLLGCLQKEDMASYFYNVVTLHQVYVAILQVVKDSGGNVEEVVGNPMATYHTIIGKQSREEMIAALAPLCITVSQHYQQTTNTKVNSAMAEVEAYIGAHFSQEDLNMKDVADHVFVSVSYLNIILKKEKGKTFIEFLTDYRMAHAKKLVLETEAKAYEIAEQCGYSSPAYFSTVFKGFYGASPSSYRKNNQKQ